MFSHGTVPQIGKSMFKTHKSHINVWNYINVWNIDITIVSLNISWFPLNQFMISMFQWRWFDDMYHDLPPAGQVPWDSGTDITVQGGSSNWLLLVAAADSPWASTWFVFFKRGDWRKWRSRSYHQLWNWMRQSKYAYSLYVYLFVYVYMVSARSNHQPFATPQVRRPLSTPRNLWHQRWWPITRVSAVTALAVAAWCDLAKLAGPPGPTSSGHWA